MLLSNEAAPMSASVEFGVNFQPEVVKERDENSHLRKVNEEIFPWRFPSKINRPPLVCAKCDVLLSGTSNYYRCHECEKPFLLCENCIKERHLHRNVDFFHKEVEPIYEFLETINKDMELTCRKILIRCFEQFREYYFCGIRDTVGNDFTWIKFGEFELQMKTLLLGVEELFHVKDDEDLMPGEMFVGILSENNLEYVLIIFICLFRGFVFVPIQTILSIEEKKRIVEETELQCCFVSQKYEKEMKEINSNIEKPIKHLIGIGKTKTNIKVNVSQLIERGAQIMEKRGEEYSNIRPSIVPKDETVCIIYTSGTSKTPKGILFTESRFLLEMKKEFETVPLVILAMSPFSHVSGINDIMFCFYCGGRFGMTQCDQSNMFDDFKTIRPTLLGTVPRVLNLVYNEYHRLCKSVDEEIVKRKFKTIFGGRLIEIFVGSAKTSIKVKSFIRKLMEIPVYDGYGSTEAGSIGFRNKLDLKGEFKLIDCKELGYLTTDNPPRGELLVKNKYTKDLQYFKYQNPATDDDGFFATGDIVQLLGNRTYVLIDRKVNILKLSQGEFVSLERLECLFSSSVHIDQILLSANTDNSFLVALVFPVDKNSDKKIIMDDILTIAKDSKMNPWEIPKDFALVEEKFEMTELKKKKRRNIVKKYQILLKQLCEKEERMKLLANVLNKENLDSTKTFRELGGDSLSAITLLNQIKMKDHEENKLSFETLMNEPINSLFEKRREVKEDYIVDVSRELEEMKLLLSKLNHQNKQNLGIVEDSPPSKLVRVFFTGSSGFVGRHVLDEMMKQFPKVCFDCLVRDEKTEMLIYQNDRITLIEGDLSLPMFGLTIEEFDKLKSNTDLIIHCGAMVNHFANLEYHYNTNVRSLFDIVRVSMAYKPIVYISTTSVYSSVPQKGDIEKERHYFYDGYSTSKWMCDVLLTKLFENSMIFRIPLVIASKATGKFNPNDWFFKLISGMIKFKVCPNTKISENMDMVAVDSLSHMIVKVIKSWKFGNQFTISFKNVSMENIITYLNDYLKIQKKENLVGLNFSDWIKKMKEFCQTGDMHPIFPFLDQIELNGFGSFKSYNCSHFDDLVDSFGLEFYKMAFCDVKKHLELMDNQEGVKKKVC